QVQEVLRRFDSDGDGRISIEEFLTFLGRKYTGTTASEAKLRKILGKAEEMGLSVAETFGAWDKDGSGEITVSELEAGLKALGVFDAIPEEQVRKLVARFDHDKDGHISLKEFMEFMGREYSETAIVEAKFRKILQRADQQGTSLEAAFGAFDKDKSGRIAITELEKGLRDLGLLEGIGPQQLAVMMKRFDRDGDGEVSLREFLAFAGRPYEKSDTGVERKLRRLVAKAEQMGTPLDEAFRHFDKDGDGVVTGAEFEEGLRGLGVFQEFPPEDMAEVLRRFDADGDGGVSLPEFMRFLGKNYHLDVGAKLHKILRKAEELGTPLAESFKQFDPAGTGSATSSTMHRGLKALKPFQKVSLAEVDAFLRSIGGSGAGAGAKGEPTVTLQGFLDFARAPLDPAAGQVRRRASAAAEVEKEKRAQRQREERRSAEAKANAGSATPEEMDKALARVSAAMRRMVGDWPAAGDLTAAGCFLPFLRGCNLSYKEGALLTGVPFRRFRSIPTLSSPFPPSSLPSRVQPKQVKDAILKVEKIKGRGTAAAAFHSFDWDDSGSLAHDELGRALCSLGLYHRNASQPGGMTATAAGDARAIIGRLAKKGAAEIELKELTVWYGGGGREKSGDGDDDAEGGGKAGGGWRGSRGDGDRPEESKDGGGGDETSKVEKALQNVLLRAEAKGVRLERAFDAFDRNGDGRLTENELLRGLEELGAFRDVRRRGVVALLRRLDHDGDGTVILAEFLRFVRHGGGGGEKIGGGGGRDGGEEPVPTAYEFSTDPETRDAEKKLRRAVAKQIRRGIDVEQLFKSHDPQNTGCVTRADFVQAIMELGLSLLDARHPASAAAAAAMAAAGEAQDPNVRRRQLAQLARTRGPVERRLLKMRMRSHHLFAGGPGGGPGGYGGGEEEDGWDAEEGAEALALIQWYREGQKKAMVRSVLASSLTTTVRLFYSFGQPLFFEHALRNPFSHEERFRIDVDDPELRVVTDAEEWAYLRRTVSPCVGSVGDTPVEAEFLDIDPKQGIQVTLMPNETVYIPFAFLSLEPVRGTPAGPGSAPGSPTKARAAGGSKRGKGEPAAALSVAERFTIVSFISASHGHIVSMLQVHVHRRPFGVDRTFRFYQPEGEILKRCIQLLPYPAPGLPPTGVRSRRRAAAAAAAAAASGRYRSAAFLTDAEADVLRAGVTGYRGLGGANIATNGDGGNGGGGKFVHCVDRGDGNVVVEWRQKVTGAGGMGGPPVDEVFIKYRVRAFPQQGDFYLLLYDDPFQARLHEVWHVVVQSRLRLDAHASVGQSAPVDIVVRGDRYARRVRCFSSAPADVSFDPPGPFQLVPGAYNRAELRYRPRATSENGAATRKIHVHMVDVDTKELVGAWLAAATAAPPVVTKTYEIDLAAGRQCHKRIAYVNPWPRARVFRLASSDDSLLRPRYESVEIGGGAAGYLRLWFQAPAAPGAAEAFLFVNDDAGQNEECLLIKMRVLP
ncbi:unnamed protein product, partial [Phaeothamnion confervicola]